MAKDPAYPMYAQDFDMDTADWEIEEVGIYIRLLNYEWINGFIPNDMSRIAKIARVSPRKLQKSWEIISKKFSQTVDHNLQNKRMEVERIKREAYSRSQSISGHKGAAAKWGSIDTNGQTRSQRLKVAREKGRHTREEFQEMVTYFNGLCVKCGDGSHGVFRDHILPIYIGGSDGIDNLQPLCRKCNTGKGRESVDYRPIFCDKHDLKMPGEWLKTSGEMHGESMAFHSHTHSLKDKEKDIPVFPEETMIFYTTKKNRKLKGTNLEKFNVFWETFDLRKGKADAADAWLDILNLDKELYQKILKGAKFESDERKRNGTERPKWAQGWLNGKRWEDELTEGSGNESIYDRLIKESEEADALVQQKRSDA